MTTTSPPPAKYLHGHHPSVLKSHSWRTAQNSAAHLLPHITPNAHILDIGCGPGTITCDLAALAPAGHTTGLDASPAVLTTARATAATRHIPNISFAQGDIYALAYADASFDVVHAHQVLQHIGDPVRALREMLRVARKGGVVACREADTAASVWWPRSRVMEDWRDTYVRTAEGSGGSPYAGRMLGVLAREAGVEGERVSVGASATCYAGADRRWWCEMWAERMQGELRGNILEGGYATVERLDEQVRVWSEMAGDEDAMFTMVHGEMIVKV
ncbi:methyltransferase type 11 [Pseudovirgaria hyperparasitica]|uniref:Methyltransferase type 11 n=1 Tax=Pseudovirgaria hyperparasitica TaxID=470096 RepID=A0A6A6W1S7_9PEZI|nr:methyltransferase type 11 [Pseudovirgaria hyperparasitica]KAF2756503.1 methyltransferase type 11 [Pseudovirgaria hyperparasitica]